VHKGKEAAEKMGLFDDVHKLGAVFGFMVLAHACYATISYRNDLKIEGTDFTSVPVAVVIECVVVRVGTFHNVSLSPSPSPCPRRVPGPGPVPVPVASPSTTHPRPRPRPRLHPRPRPVPVPVPERRRRRALFTLFCSQDTMMAAGPCM
jgi:hypothetical protein